jgi:hypothetical protein
VKRFSLPIGILCVVLGQAGVNAIDAELTVKDIERATELARWPHTDAERAQFHQRYTVPVKGPVVEYFAIEKIEIITPFRRLELIAEEHARLNDLFARGGVGDAQEALRPWRDRVSIVAHLRFDLAKLIPGVPELEMTLGGSNPVFPITTDSSRIEIANGNQTQIIGGLVDAGFAVRDFGPTAQPVVVWWNGKELARVAVDFAKLD